MKQIEITKKRVLLGVAATGCLLLLTLTLAV